MFTNGRWPAQVENCISICISHSDPLSLSLSLSLSENTLSLCRGGSKYTTLSHKSLESTFMWWSNFLAMLPCFIWAFKLNVDFCELFIHNICECLYCCNISRGGDLTVTVKWFSSDYSAECSVLLIVPLWESWQWWQDLWLMFINQVLLNKLTKEEGERNRKREQKYHTEQQT